MSNLSITPEELNLHAKWVRNEPGGVRLVKVGAILTGTNLTGAILTGADFAGADLSRASLFDADLARANLTGAILTGAILSRADLSHAILSRASLFDADLTRASLFDADLTDADLTGAILTGAIIFGADLTRAIGLSIAADAPARLTAAAKAALQPGALEMDSWHICDTTHCLSGWAVHQAGEVGRVLEAAVGNHMAGLYLLGTEAASHFYDSNDQATDYLQGVLAAAGEGSL